LTAPVLKLRQANLDDVKEIRSILAAAAADLTARFGQGHWSTVRTIETLQKYVNDGVLYVVEVDLTAVAALRLTNRKIGFYRNDWFARPKDPAGYLMDMAVRPDHQRRGIGRRSMQLTEQLGRRAGLQTIRLDAYKGPAGAGEFYKKCGYALVHQGAFKGVALEYFEKLLPPHS
jgi:GNAT superfamily N-acetyltransferase